MARRQAIRGRSPARQPAGRRADGPDLREPGGPQRQARPARRGPRHPRDLRADGDERRGDGGLDRRRPHVRQVARRGPRRQRRPGPGGCADRGAGPRLEEPLRHREGRRHDHQRTRGRLERHAHELVERLLRQPLRLRVAAHQEPRRRLAVDAQGGVGQRHGARRPRRLEVARADDVHDRSGPEDGSRLRPDRQAVPRAPGRVSAGVRPGLVQAHAP